MRKKFYHVDLFLICLLLLSLIGALLRTEGCFTDQKGLQNAYVVRLIAKRLPPSVVDCLEEGEWLFDAYGEAVGEVQTIRKKQTAVELYDEGEAYVGEWSMELYCNAEIDLLVFGTYEGDTLLLGGVRPLLIGEELLLRGDRMRVLWRVEGVSAR